MAATSLSHNSVGLEGEGWSRGGDYLIMYVRRYFPQPRPNDKKKELSRALNFLCKHINVLFFI